MSCGTVTKARSAPALGYRRRRACPPRVPGCTILAMTIETVIVLPEDLKAALDRRAASPAERDGLVAAALRAYFAGPRPGEDAADLGIINAHADELNAQAQAALSCQVPL